MPLTDEQKFNLDTFRIQTAPEAARIFQRDPKRVRMSCCPNLAASTHRLPAAIPGRMASALSKSWCRASTCNCRARRRRAGAAARQG